MVAVLKKYYNLVWEQKIHFLLLCVTYLVGIILGVLLCKELERLFFAENAVAYYVSALSRDSNVFSSFISRVFSFIGVFVVFGLCGLNIWLFAVHYAIILYRGYILGAVAVVFVTVYGISGVVFFLFVILLQNLIITFSLIVLSSLMMSVLNSSFCTASAKKKRYIESIIIALIIAFIGALLEFLILVLVLRPSVFYF